MRRGAGLAAGAVMVALLAGSCAELKRAAPTGPGILAEGTTNSWGSATSAAALAPGKCGYVEGTVTSRTKTTGEGTFTEICGGSVTLHGTAKGAAFGTIIQFTGSGTASGPDGGSCPFTLAGNAVPEGLNAFRVTHSGSSCYGPFSGSDLLAQK
jgi:hypothetical protein